MSGGTRCVEERLARHNAGRVCSTKKKSPFKLIYYEDFGDYASARQREKYLKSGFGRVVLRQIQKRYYASVAKLADAPA